MDSKFLKLPEKVKQNGLSPERKERIRLESCDNPAYEIPDDLKLTSPNNIYEYHDLSVLQSMNPLHGSYNASIHSIDDLLERDKQREKDGFPRKIRVGRMIKPGRGGKDKIVVVLTTVEEKFIHDRSLTPSEEDPSGGSGEGEEGEVIGEQPVRGESGEGGAGEGEGGPHEMESSAYDLGRLLTEQFQLPNLKDKGKKRALTRYTYDMTDRHRGFGQILDKKATLRKIVETNISLGRLPDVENIDPTRFLISPHDKIYRILSREMDYESQALVFFLRDYSGSMFGKPTELVVSQHVLIYSWLLFQYARQVETRFILHDTDATEVPDFYTYYNSKVAGGTKVVSAYRLVNEIVEKEGLVQDYNIYVFHGTDGDDWDSDGKETLPELERMLAFSNRVGITVASRSVGSGKKSAVETYLNGSRLLEQKSDLLRLNVMEESADEARLIEGIKKLIN
ncbi:MAG: DUF444 family protein [Deltaproteobacteria bacterium]|nr:DUF444 family protein [Deltaproteobacteria bacterium]